MRLAEPLAAPHGNGPREEPPASGEALRRQIPWHLIAPLAGGIALIVAAQRWGKALQASGVRLQLGAPPLTGSVDPRLPAAALGAVLLAALVIWKAPAIAASARWRTLMVVSFIAAGGWALALALTDGIGGYLAPVASPANYLHNVGRVGALGPFLRGFVANLGTYTTHVRAHPPGMLLLVWLLGKAGAPGPGAVAALQLVGAAAAAPALLVAFRSWAGEDRARAAAPFLVLAPFAVMFGSGDALFMGVAAWSCALLILATAGGGRAQVVLAAAGGLLLGAALMLSYGLVLLVLVPAAVIVARRRALVGVVALACASGVLGVFALAGFWWWDGLMGTRIQYAESIARFRPGGYFLVANLAALLAAVGPAAWVGLTRLRDRRVWLVSGAALAAIALADASGLSKGEVERIWLPFMPWLIAGAAWGLVAERDEVNRGANVRTIRIWLAVQVVWALGLQLLVRSPW
ncbi:MAG: hypothetical protein ABI828_01975 [Actinomycetota bacterium]